MQSTWPVGPQTYPEARRSGLTAAGRTANELDDELMHRAASGERAAMTELVRRHQAALYRFMYRLLASREDAEDATMEVFLRAWRYAGRFQYRSSVLTWLYRIGANVARDAGRLRRERAEVPLPDRDDVVADAIGSAENDALKRLQQDQRAQAVHDALRKLCDRDRLVLVLYYLEDRSYPEIQAISGLSYVVLKTCLARARTRLRRALEARRDWA